MAQLTVLTGQQDVSVARTGANAGGDSFLWSDRVFLYLNNGTNGQTVTITVPAANTPQNVPGGGALTIPPIVINQVAGATNNNIYGPIPIDYMDPATRLVSLTYSSVTALNVAALRSDAPI